MSCISLSLKGASAAVGVEDVAVHVKGPLPDVAQVEDRTQAAADEPLIRSHDVGMHLGKAMFEEPWT